MKFFFLAVLLNSTGKLSRLSYCMYLSLNDYESKDIKDNDNAKTKYGTNGRKIDLCY